MIEMTAGEVVKIIRGELLYGSPEMTVSGVCVDSRASGKDGLFFALKGEHLDGTHFIADAFSRGAAGAVVDKRDFKEVPPERFLVFSENVLDSLGRLAEAVRVKQKFKVIGITGSSGKTTVRCMLQSILAGKFRTISSEKNYNNEIGVPLTLLRGDTDTEIMIVEMAMRARGEIADLCRIAKPDMGLITNIGSTHYELLGSRKNIALAKKELADSLKPDSILVLNHDDRWAEFLKSDFMGKVATFGFSNDADVRPIELKYDAEGHGVFRIIFEDGNSCSVELPYPGAHQVINALAAAAAARQFEVETEKIKAGLEGYHLEGMRMESYFAAAGYRIINDAYNANPDSMEAALLAFSSITGFKRKIAVLGDMLELGAISDETHLALGGTVAGAGIDILLTVGEKAALIQEGLPADEKEEIRHRHFEDAETAARYLISVLRPGDGVLIKGSRGMKLEKIAEAVKDL